jgi:hypothetical protein
LGAGPCLIAGLQKQGCWWWLLGAGPCLIARLQRQRGIGGCCWALAGLLVCQGRVLLVVVGCRLLLDCLFVKAARCWLRLLAVCLVAKIQLQVWKSNLSSRICWGAWRPKFA